MAKYESQKYVLGHCQVTELSRITETLCFLFNQCVIVRGEDDVTYRVLWRKQPRRPVR